MRLFYFSLLFLFGNVLAAPPDCDESDITAGANLNTCTSLTVNGPAINLTGSSGGKIQITNITGNVEINTSIILDGNNGTSDIGNGSGALGGPGAGDGGGISFGTTEDASIDDGFGGRQTVAADGKTFVSDTPCASGGGGGGFAVAGSPGVKCPTSSSPNNGGSSSSGLFAFTLAQFRGGFGGGGAAYGNASTIGTGGGGGGAIYIQATGIIKIANGVVISARGGNGGNNTTDGGGGGAGSGGAVWLVSATGINNKGSIDTRGGTGGRNNSTGAHGGNGSPGRYRLEVSGAVTEGTGLFNGKSKLKSDISCGIISKPETKNQNLIFQIMIGFIFAFSFKGLRTLFRFRAIT